jgi:hypothetical protein
MLRLDRRPHRISKCIDISLDSSKLHRMRCSRQGSMALITIGHPNSFRSRSIPIGPDLCGRHGGVSIQNLIPRCQRGVRTIRTMVRQKLETGGDRVGELKADAPRNNEFQWDVAVYKKYLGDAIACVFWGADSGPGPGSTRRWYCNDQEAVEDYLDHQGL